MRSHQCNLLRRWAFPFSAWAKKVDQLREQPTSNYQIWVTREKRGRPTEVLSEALFALCAVGFGEYLWKGQWPGRFFCPDLSSHWVRQCRNRILVLLEAKDLSLTHCLLYMEFLHNKPLPRRQGPGFRFHMQKLVLGTYFPAGICACASLRVCWATEIRFITCVVLICLKLSCFNNYYKIQNPANWDY